MNVVLAIIADGGRGIFVIYREGVEINHFQLYFIDSSKTLQRRLCPTPCKEAPGGAVFVSVKTMPLEGEMACRGGKVCVLVLC
jgi:hypothetical protein